jgi:V8-like Glu-specific endopeptidase
MYLITQRWGQLAAANEDLEVAPTTVPTPGRFYIIQYGKGGLLKTAEKAYKTASTAARLKRAEEINNHPENRKFWRKPGNDFERKTFPDGVIDFNPGFTCNEDQRRAAKGERKCFARIWIPSTTSAERTFTYVKNSKLDWSNPGLAQLVELFTDHCHESSLQLPGLFGKDDRIEIHNTQVLPFRWVCKLFTVYFPKKNQALPPRVSHATGFFLDGNQTLITSAHVLYNDDDPDYSPAPASIFFLPGFKRVPSKLSPLDQAAVPFGAFVVTNQKHTFRVSKEWINTKNSKFDYGVIDVTDSRKLLSGKKLEDSWETVSTVLAASAASSHSAKEIAPLLLQHHKALGKGIHYAGYPGDKPCTPMRVEHGRFAKLDDSDDAEHNVLIHHTDTVPGNSGSPVWLERQAKDKKSGLIKTQRLLIGIVEGGRGPRRDQEFKSPRPVLVNMITVITPEVLRRLKAPSLLTAV